MGKSLVPPGSGAGDHIEPIDLKKALEEGYKDFNNVYKDVEFAELRKDKRFTELMAAKPPALPE